MTKKKLQQTAMGLIAAALVGLSLSICIRWGGANLLLLGSLTDEIGSICAEASACRQAKRQSAFSKEAGRVETFYLLTLNPSVKAAEHRTLLDAVNRTVQEYEKDAVTAKVTSIRTTKPFEVRYAQ